MERRLYRDERLFPLGRRRPRRDCDVLLTPAVAVAVTITAAVTIYEAVPDGGDEWVRDGDLGAAGHPVPRDLHGGIRRRRHRDAPRAAGRRLAMRGVDRCLLGRARLLGDGRPFADPGRRLVRADSASG